MTVDVRAARGANPARIVAWIALGIALVLQTSCVVLPVRVASGVSGRVLDRSTGEPLADSLVVVRFEGQYDQTLPDRALLGHREARTDAAGRFSVEAWVSPGVSIWPAYRARGRVVAVMKDGYGCASPRAMTPPRDLAEGDFEIRLAPEPDRHTRRHTCRPVPARRGEVVEYMAAWRALFPKSPAATDDDELERVLDARAAFGFGENCRGPVLDLSLSPDGTRSAFVVAEGAEASIRVRELGRGDHVNESTIARVTGSSAPRLGWTAAGDLVTWSPGPDSPASVRTGRPGHADPTGPSGLAGGRFERVWSASGPAHAAADADDPVEGATGPIRWTDESDARWMGRSFSLKRLPDPTTGLAVDQLQVRHDDGSTYTLTLPGESCGSLGRFGRPHHRIAADGRSGFDLRFVGGGCRVVRTDLDDGHWEIVDGVDEPGICSSSRRVPATHLSAALRSYVRDVEAIAAGSGADPAAAYALRIEPGGVTRLETKTFRGEIVTIDVPEFPLATPLRRIEVSILGSVPRANDATNVRRLEPL